MYREIEKLINGLKPGFFGTIEIGIQNSKPHQVRITETFKLSHDNSSRVTRGNDERQTNPE